MPHRDKGEGYIVRRLWDENHPEAAKRHRRDSWLRARGEPGTPERARYNDRKAAEKRARRRRRKSAQVLLRKATIMAREVLAKRERGFEGEINVERR